MIGIFAINANSGTAMTTHKDRWILNWSKINKNIDLIDNKFDFILAVQRWKGFGGKTNPSGYCYDASNFISALSSITKKIHLISTIHVPLVHPVMAARIFSTIDNINNGRTGLNIVCGWQKREFSMFDTKIVKPNEKFKQATDWIKIFEKTMYSKRIFSFKSKYFNSMKVYDELAPKNKIFKISAAFSNEGKDFAIKNCDSLLTVFSSISSGRKIIKSLKSKKKSIKVILLCHVVCKKTDKEAIEYYNFYSSKKIDLKAVNNYINFLFEDKKNDNLKKILQSQKEKIAAGLSSMPLIGNPNTIKNKIKELESIGVDGLALSFVNYDNDVSYFAKNVL